MDLLRTELERRMELAASPAVIARALGSRGRPAPAGAASKRDRVAVAARDGGIAGLPSACGPAAGDRQARRPRRAWGPIHDG